MMLKNGKPLFNINQFVEEIKDLAKTTVLATKKQEPQGGFLNGTSLKGVVKLEITNPMVTLAV